MNWWPDTPESSPRSKCRPTLIYVRLNLIHGRQAQYNYNFRQIGYEHPASFRGGYEAGLGGQTIFQSENQSVGETITLFEMAVSNRVAPQ